MCNLRKKGLFLRVDASGVCNACAVIRQQEQHNLAKTYFDKLKSLYINITDEISVPDDPIERLSVIDQIHTKENLCSDCLSLLQQYSDYEYFFSIVIENVEYESETEKKINFGEVKPFNISIWTNRADSLEQFISKLTDVINQVKHNWSKHEEKIRSMAQFQTTLQSLPRCEVVLRDSGVPLQNIYEMPDITFSNITAKSNYEKLGDFVVIDTETTGLKAGYDRIIEVSALRFRNWRPELLFTTLLNPDKKIDSFIEDLTGINDGMLREAPHFPLIIESLSSFIGSDNIVGHNLLFDLKFLYKNGLNIFSSKRKYYDTLELSRKTFHDLDNYKLDTLCEYYGIRDNCSSHRSSSDCYATALLFKKIAFYRTH